jgi:class 3 adenylate cyclase
MGADETGTHAALMAHLRVLSSPKIEEHGGRVVKNTGDGFLADFVSAVEAVNCAVAIQRGMVERNAEVPREKRIEFRMGINVETLSGTQFSSGGYYVCEIPAAGEGSASRCAGPSLGSRSDSLRAIHPLPQREREVSAMRR